MVLPLHRLVDKYLYIHDRILGSPIVPNLTFNGSTLLHVQSKPINDTPTSVDDSSALVSQCDDHIRSRKPEKGRHKCDLCGKLGLQD